LAGDDPEEDLDHVQPRSRGRGEVHRDPRIAHQPRFHRGMVVGRVVVHDQVQRHSRLGLRVREILQRVREILQAGDPVRRIAFLPRDHGRLGHPTRCTISFVPTPSSASSTIRARRPPRGGGTDSVDAAAGRYLVIGCSPSHRFSVARLAHRCR